MSNAGHDTTHQPLSDAFSPLIAKSEQAASAQECLSAIDSLFEHTMTKQEEACFRREKASKFVPLKPEQTRLLPPRKK